MTVNVIDIKTEEVVETIECNNYENNTVIISSGMGTSTITYDDTVYLKEIYEEANQI